MAVACYLTTAILLRRVTTKCATRAERARRYRNPTRRQQQLLVMPGRKNVSTASLSRRGEPEEAGRVVVQDVALLGFREERRGVYRVDSNADRLRPLHLI